MSASLVLVGYGALTSVGLNAAQTCAAIRAAVTGFADSAFYQDTRDTVPLVGAQAPDPISPAEDDDFDRLVRLATPPLRECLEAGGLEPQDVSRPIEAPGHCVVAENTSADRMHQNQWPARPRCAEINQWRAAPRGNRLNKSSGQHLDR